MEKYLLNIDSSTLSEEVIGFILEMKLALEKEQSGATELRHKNASLTQDISLLQADNKTLLERIASDEERIALLVQESEERMSLLLEEIERLKKLLQKRAIQIFCSKSEKMKERTALFNTAGSPIKEDTLEVQDTTVTPKAKNKSRGKAIDPGLKRVDIIIDLKDEEKICRCCGTKKSLIGEEVSEKLEVIPVDLYVNRYRRRKYACRVCGDGVQTATPEKTLLPKCMAEPSLLAHIITGKYVDHLPLYRQEAILERIGIPLRRGTLNSWALKTGEALKPLYDHMHQKILACSYVQADETTLQVLKEDGRTPQSKSYMWLYKTGIDQYVLYDYQTTREGKHPSTFLEGFEGYLQSDAYSGYNEVCAQKTVTSVLCWAHARRKFYDITKLTKSKKGFAHEMVGMIGWLYKIERECREQNLTYEETKKIRKRRAISILRKIRTRLERALEQSPPQSDIGAAIRYTLNNWKGLIQYLKDGRLHIDNNAAERRIKPFVIGRKNWLFSQNVRGAKASTVLFSILETAKAHHINPQAYLEFVIKKFPVTANLDDILPNAYLKTLSGLKSP